MELIIKYRSGEVRHTRLTPEFFRSSEVSIPKKAMDFAYDHGHEPYHIQVFRDSVPVHQAFINKNKPETFAKEDKIDEKKAKKQARKAFKRERNMQF